MPARRPRFSPNETTSAPPRRATSAVLSVDPSSTTSTSTWGSASRASASTPGSELSSFQAGMNTTVSLRVIDLLPRNVPHDALIAGPGCQTDEVGLASGADQAQADQ